MNPEQTRAAIRNVFGLPPVPAIRAVPRATPTLRRVARAGWPDLDDLLTRRPALPPYQSTAMTFGDLLRLEERCYATAGYVDEALFWWLTEHMLGCLAAGRL